MAQCKQTPQDFIQNAFSPVVSVICSTLVEQVSRKNNLSFIELLQPFCRLNAEAQIRDSTGASVTIRNLRINLANVNARPMHQTFARKFLNSSVKVTSEIRMSTVQVNDYSLEIPVAIPWFEMWRETFLKVQYPSDHEFTKHFLACMIVVSSSETNPLETVNQLLQNLTQLQNTGGQSKLPKWFNNNVLRYFVVLHDTIDGNNDAAIKTVEQLKQTYGVGNCFLLQMNSRPPGLTDESLLPDPWSQFLVRKPDNSDIPETESPRTPAEAGGVTSMPSNVISSDSARVSSGSTSPTLNRNMQKLEIGQEANEGNTVPVAFHPLSPDVENPGMISSADEDEHVNLPINSNVWHGAATTPAVIHGACLTTDDIEQLKLLIHEFCLRSLLPYVEKQIQQLSDVISNKKGVSRSLFSATKRWFTPNKLGAAGSAAAVNAVIYTNDAPELQLRRLGDLYFMFGHYNMAFQIYHSAKRDFNADQAWLYYAGALEMAALSAFMCGEVTRKTCDYMEESISTYLYTCRLPQFATRATLLSTECLKGKAQYGEAAHQFIRMTSEDSDLRSALLLEQAAYCFLHYNKPRMIRKYAFHIVLAGHRFSKCLQREHSLRCYRQAFQVYNNKGWSLAEDHIYFTIGKQASYLKQLEEAKDAFSKLLTPKSKQNAQQQTIFLKEYLNAHYSLLKENTEQNKILPMLPLPSLDHNNTKVLLGPQMPVSIPGRIPASGVSFTSDENTEMNQKWIKLEEVLVQEAYGNQPMVFKSMTTLFSNKNSGNIRPIAVMGEPIQILVHIENPLQIMLPLKNIYLLWQFTEKENNTTINNENFDDNNSYKYIRTHSVDFVNLDPDCKQELVLSVTPLAVGNLVIKGVCFTIINNSVQDGSVGVTGKQEFNIRGPKLNTKDKDNISTYGQDKRLDIIVAPSAPCLQVGFSEINQELLCNELQNISIELRNCGSTPLHKIMMASSLPHLFTLSKNTNIIFEPSKSNNTVLKESDITKMNVTPITLPSSFNGRLEPGQSHVINLWLRAPATKGTALVDLLFYYENMNPESIPRYRLVRHVWHLSVQDSLSTVINVKHSRDCTDVETITFSLRVTNCNQIHHAVISEITLLQASLISPNWELSKDAIILKDVKLQSQESLHFLLKAYRSVNKEKSTNYSELLLSDHIKVNPEIKQPCINFAQRYMQYESFSSDNTKIEQLNNIEATLILGWQALVTDSAGNKRTVIGQHYLPIDKVSRILENSKTSLQNENEYTTISTTTTTTTTATTAAIVAAAATAPLFTSFDNILMAIMQKQITYTLAHPPLLKHDFVNNKICIVPVKLILHNNADKDLTVKVITLGTSSDSAQVVNKSELFTINSSSNYRWMGHSEFVCNVKAFNTHQLLLHMAVIAPGTYDLGERIRISCKTPNQNQENNVVLQVCRVHSALIVKTM